MAGSVSRSCARPSWAGDHSTDQPITTASTAPPHVMSCFSRAVRTSQKRAQASASAVFMIRS
jgi:hypothetical protein